jgi:hypothetical protein
MSKNLCGRTDYRAFSNSFGLEKVCEAVIPYTPAIAALACGSIQAEAIEGMAVSTALSQATARAESLSVTASAEMH